MRIALVGSWKPQDEKKWDLKDLRLFAAACGDIGAAIVQRGHVLVVGSDGQHTADYHAVTGAVRSIATLSHEKPRIVILRPNDAEVPFPELRREHSQLFSSRVAPDAEWQTTKLFQVKEADCLVILGGADTSYLAGLAAALSGKRLVPIGSFGGAAKRLINTLTMSHESWGTNIPTRDELGLLHSPWSNGLRDSAIRLFGVQLPKLLIVHGRGNDKLLLKNFLQNRLNLPEPIIMGEQPSSGLTLPEKFERLAQQAHAAIAVVTPDDVGALAASSESDIALASRARQNVWLEVGWFWGNLGRSRFLLLCREKTEIPSDLQGVEYVPYREDPAEASEKIRGLVDALRVGVL